MRRKIGRKKGREEEIKDEWKKGRVERNKSREIGKKSES